MLGGGINLVLLSEVQKKETISAYIINSSTPYRIKVQYLSRQ